MYRLQNGPISILICWLQEMQMENFPCTILETLLALFLSQIVEVSCLALTGTLSCLTGFQLDWTTEEFRSGI